MKKIVIAFLFIAAGVNAQTTCRDTVFGVTCTDASLGGSTTYRSTPMGTFGSDGTVIRNTPLGTTVTQPGQGTTTYRSTPLGTVGSDGTMIRKDVFGTTITSPNGKQVRCRETVFGTTCQ
jgi:hypothetical protein